jgi:agmatinase
MTSAYPTWSEFQSSPFVATKSFPRLSHETPTFFGVPVAISPADLQGADFVIIGAPFVGMWYQSLLGVSREEWLATAQRVRQQSIRYRSGYVQDFDIDIFEHVKVVDYGDAVIPERPFAQAGTVETILEAQAAMEKKVNDVLDAGAVPIVFGGFAPLSAYAIAKPLAERAKGKVGMVCLDAHWDSHKIDGATMDARVAGAGSWKNVLYREHKNFDPKHLVEIGERGMLEHAEIVRSYIKSGATFVSAWRLRTELGIQGTVELLPKAFQQTSAVFAHLDLDVMGGAGASSGDVLGDLAEPIGLTDYEVIRIAHEIGKLGTSALTFASIFPTSPAMLRVAVYSIIYFIAGHALTKRDKAAKG